MKQFKNIFTFLLFCITLLSCVQSKTESIPEKVENKKVIEKKYTKIISDSTNKLTGKIEKLEVSYTIWGCACPQWIRTKDIKARDTTKSYLSYHFYLEPANEKLELPVYFYPDRHLAKIEGQFYEREDYPQGTIEMEEPMPKAKVFRYTKIEIVNNPDFKSENKTETLILNYNAISCTCAQWSDKNKKTYYWLEPLNEKLINADELFNGTNLPIQIKVTGQVVCESCFPNRKNLSKVNDDEAGKVFQYSKIEVLQNGEK